MDYVDRESGSGFPENQLPAISSAIEGLIEEGHPLHEIVVYSAISLRNKWATEFNNDKNNKTKVMLSVSKNNTFISKMEFYFNNFSNIDLSLLLSDLSRIPVPFQGVTDRNRLAFLSSLTMLYILVKFFLQKTSSLSNFTIL